MKIVANMRRFLVENLEIVMIIVYVNVIIGTMVLFNRFIL